LDIEKIKPGLQACLSADRDLGIAGIFLPDAEHLPVG
tara:strand:- start:5857 stop:5967 length:111 start_codon:yes stop_codon:yes gene_type:complete